MKKLLVLILAAAITLSLTACDKADNDSGSSGESSASTTELSGGAPDTPDMNFPEGLVSLNEKNSSCTKDGFYYLEDDLAKNGDFKHIMYIDFATKQETYLCSDSSCDHNNERCSSCFIRKVPQNMSTEMFVYGEYLYILYICRSFDGGFQYSSSSDGHGTPIAGMQSASDKQCLYRMNLDGTNRTIIYSFGSELFVKNFVFGDDDNLWFYVHEENLKLSKLNGYSYIEAQKPALIKLSLSQHAVIEQIPVKEISDVSLELRFCSGNKFVFGGVQYPDGMTEMEYMERLQELDEKLAEKAALEKGCQGVYYTLNRDNKEFKEFYRTDTYIYLYQVYRGDLYLLPDEPGVGIKVDIETGNVEDFTAAEGYTIYDGMFADKFICRKLTDPPESMAFYFVDPNTGMASKCDLQTAENFMPIQPVSMYEGNAFVLYRYDMIPNEKGNYSGWYPEYAFMTPDDLFNGRPNYDPIKMLEKGKKK